MISPPYTSDFVHMFLPLIENESITGTLRNENGKDPVSEFICKYLNVSPKITSKEVQG